MVVRANKLQYYDMSQSLAACCVSHKWRNQARVCRSELDNNNSGVCVRFEYQTDSTALQMRVGLDLGERRKLHVVTVHHNKAALPLGVESTQLHHFGDGQD